jgi:hypothetical protein
MVLIFGVNIVGLGVMVYVVGGDKTEGPSGVIVPAVVLAGSALQWHPAACHSFLRESVAARWHLRQAAIGNVIKAQIEQLLL